MPDVTMPAASAAVIVRAGAAAILVPIVVLRVTVPPLSFHQISDPGSHHRRCHYSRFTGMPIVSISLSLADSEPELLLRNVARVLACGLEVVGHRVGAIRPLAGRHPELHEPQPRAQTCEARIVTQLGHSRLEQ